MAKEKAAKEKAKQEKKKKKKSEEGGEGDEEDEDESEEESDEEEESEEETDSEEEVSSLILHKNGKKSFLCVLKRRTCTLTVLPSSTLSFINTHLLIIDLAIWTLSIGQSFLPLFRQCNNLLA